MNMPTYEDWDSPRPYYKRPEPTMPEFIDPNTPTVGDRKPKPQTYKKRINRNRIARQSRKKNR